MTFNRQRSERQVGLNRTPAGRLSRDFRIHKVEIILLVGREKRSMLPNSVKCVLHVTSEVKLDTFVNSVFFCFTKGLVLRNTIQ
jgi:hypothetical protein